MCRNDRCHGSGTLFDHDNFPLTWPEHAEASFAQDAYYLASSASASVIVYAFPSTGAFVVEDRVGGSGSMVQFFGSDWNTRNPASAGAAPSSFKGFWSSPGSPITCGGRFGAGPGNSDKPLSAVPTYMGTIVTSEVVKNGSSITGTRLRLVVVRTTQFDASPGRGGSGVVVADIACT